MRKTAIIICLALLLAGCGDNNTDTSSGNSSTVAITGASESIEGFEFIYNDLKIRPNGKAAPVISSLGEAKNYFESPSCAFSGVDKFYVYNSFEINTYPKDGTDYIYIIKLLDDSVETKEGICIGDKFSEVKTALPDDYEEKNGFYTYKRGKTNLEIIVVNDTITDIKYIAITD
ncbi:MAG: hypothetical protein PHD46_01920 [Eubacteriales bacterium]|nr:hypothetical protein [Eubacteriales bacterium]MDD4421773.1 hypothetical protein [Eubacteriales bacterium]HBR31608.1 hypothetical protein [Clostridiales bacterium]